MLGLAVGNALGLLTEGFSREAVAARFPGGVREIDPRERTRPWDDDLAQAALLAEALLEDPLLDPQGFADRLVRWAEESGRGMGSLTRRVIAKLAAGTPASAAAREAWEEEGRQAAGNGAVMRCAPVALRWRGSGPHLVEVTERSALVTHFDPRCVWSAVALNVALARALGGADPDLQALAARLDVAGAPRAVGEAVCQAGSLPLEAFGLDDRATMGCTLKAMQVGLWALRQPPDFDAALRQVVGAGGDTDTNGAVAGAVLGGRVGLEGIPERWLASIAEGDRLAGLADRLFG
jgi:ADP-ribosylglycohydrolase